MLRRGLDVTALPCDGEYDYLASHPFSIWENANIISCTGHGKDEIESVMNSWGEGARAQIIVMWTHTAGHTFLAEQRGGEHILLILNQEMRIIWIGLILQFQE